MKKNLRVAILCLTALLLMSSCTVRDNAVAPQPTTEPALKATSALVPSGEMPADGPLPGYVWVKTQMDFERGDEDDLDNTWTVSQEIVNSEGGTIIANYNRCWFHSDSWNSLRNDGPNLVSQVFTLTVSNDGVTMLSLAPDHFFFEHNPPQIHFNMNALVLPPNADRTRLAVFDVGNGSPSQVPVSGLPYSMTIGIMWTSTFAVAIDTTS